MDYEKFHALIESILGPEEVVSYKKNDNIDPPFPIPDDLSDLEKIDLSSRIGYAGTASNILVDDIVHFSDIFDQD